MNMRSRTGQFSTAAKWCHWLVAFFMLTLINEAFGFKWKLPQDRALAIPVHVAIGLIILSMTFVRLAIRQVMPPPPHPVGLSSTMKMGATIGHFFLYALVFYMATIGLFMAAISPVDIRIFSGFNISAFAPANPELLAALRPFHFAGALAFVAVLLGHVSAALWHHFVLKDDILVRMLPFSGFGQKILDLGKVEAWRYPSTNQVNWSRKSTWFRDNRSVS
jgi:cytochrome b561